MPVALYMGDKDMARTEPTRFFHATKLRNLDEMDRLGIVLKEDLGDCCYTRALRAIEGIAPDTPPDMGLEWRLMPISDVDCDPHGSISLWEQRDPEWWRPCPAARRKAAGLFEVLLPGGIYPNHYVEAKIMALGDLERAIASGELLKVRGIGAKRFEAIKRAVEALGSDPAAASKAGR